MDDYNISSLHESRNEWISRLVNILSPQILKGLKSIYTEAYKLCLENDEEDKYLMTFQNLLSRIPKWNEEIIDEEVKRITNDSNCNYLDDLITCVHIIQLKSLTCIRVGQKQKKIDINIPKLNNFIHKVYIHSARRIYTNIYLFKKDISPLDVQKNNRELEILIQESVINSIRESIPVDDILRAYLDESVEENVLVSEEIVNEVVPEKKEEATSTEVQQEKAGENDSTIVLKKDDNIKIEEKSDNINLDIKALDPVAETTPSSSLFSLNNSSINKQTPIITSLPSSTLPPVPTTSERDVNNVMPIKQSISFSNVDESMSTDKLRETISAPKTIERLEKISHDRNEQRKLEELNDMEDDDEKITIMSDEISLNPNSIESLDNIVLNEVTNLV